MKNNILSPNYLTADILRFDRLLMRTDPCGAPKNTQKRCNSYTNFISLYIAYDLKYKLSKILTF